MPFHRRLACKLNYFQSIILMFAAVILIGAALLMLPISAQERTVTPFHEALFTATSAVCVTGLVVRDTASHWSAFGQAVLMVLIQIGGLGVITVGASFSLLSGRRISLSQRGRMQEAMSAPKVGGIVRLTGFVIRYGSDHVLDYIELDHDHAILEVSVPSAWIGKTVGDINIRKKYSINILGIKRNGIADVNIDSDTVLPGDGTLLVLGEGKALSRCFHI